MDRSVWDAIRDAWADALAERLGRPAAEIRAGGLGAADFRAAQSVELAFPDGSAARFQSAFFVVDRGRRQVAVFTEHCGSHVFPLGDLEIRAISSDFFAA